MKGFFRGLPPTLVGIIPARATYFWAYSTSKAALNPTLGDSTLTHILSGIAAVCACLVYLYVWGVGRWVSYPRSNLFP